jgi:hypothetical protein
VDLAYVEATNPETGTTVVSESRKFTVNAPLECESAPGKLGPSICSTCLDGCQDLDVGGSCCSGVGCLCEDECSYANTDLDCSMYGSDFRAEVVTDSYVGPMGEYWQWIVARGCCHKDCSGIKASYDDDSRDICTGCFKCHEAVVIDETIESLDEEETEVEDAGTKMENEDAEEEAELEKSSSSVIPWSLALYFSSIINFAPYG